MFEKYGEDQLWSQLAMSMLLYNCIGIAIFLVRFNYGPLYFAVGAFENYIAN